MQIDLVKAKFNYITDFRLSMSQPTIHIKGLSVSYDRKRVLSNVYLDIEEGNLYGILGPNGAGKSTLFKSILGLVEPNTGHVLINNQPAKNQYKKVVYVPQKGDVDWNFPATVMDVVLMGRYPHVSFFSRIKKNDIEIAKSSLHELGIFHLRNRQIGQLSGGQQQRVFLARAIAQHADIFLLDEPMVGVDIKTEEMIIETLKNLVKRGKTILVIHHDLGQVKNFFSHIVLLNQYIVDYGKVEDVFTEENLKRTYRGELNILHKIM